MVDSMKLCGFFLLFLGFCSDLGKCNDPSSFKCTEDFCLEYEVENAHLCALPDVLKCNNESSAILLPQASECNCCDSCLTFLGEGDACILGSPGLLLPTVMCGPGLKCVKNKCTQLPPEVEDPLSPKRNYECVNGECTCVMRDGDVVFNIFGTFPEEDLVNNTNPQCKCSEVYYKAQNLPVQSTPWNNTEMSVRCLPNGQFDPLQCFEDYCVCVDQYLGSLDETIPRIPVGRLGPNSPLCFDAEKFNHTRSYFKDCEKSQRLLQLERDFVEAEGFIFMFPYRVECTASGDFAEVNEVALEALRAVERTAKSSRKRI